MLTAIIREAECIGCSRCVSACPVDAIVGTHKFLHSVLTDECIGCKLCLNPCPVDCIDIKPLASVLPEGADIDKPRRAIKAKARHKERQVRLQREAQHTLEVFQDKAEKKAFIRSEIAQAIARVKSKRV